MKTFKSKTVLILIFFLCMLGLCGFAPTYALTSNEVRYAEAENRNEISTFSTEITRLDYTNKTVVEKNQTPGMVPHFLASGSMTNGCGAVAGTNLVAYYDKYYEDLIPNYISYYTKTGKYKNADSVYIPGVMNSLYSLMRTNVDDVGVSQTDFKQGLKTYISQKGFNTTYTSLMGFSALNYQQFKNSIDANDPVVLFCNPCNIYVLSYFDGYDTLGNIEIPSAHIMIGYGYMKINYVNNGVVHTETLLMVSTGKVTPTYAFLRLGDNIINGACKLNFA